MGLSSEQLHRAEDAFESRQRLRRLRAMTRGELAQALRGEPTEVAKWVQSAAEHGVGAAQLRWGAMLLEGFGVAPDAGLALHWFLRAARAGDSEAMNMAGRCFENGWGSEPDLAQAARWYRRSADCGHDWGEYNYANLLFDGRGVALDRKLALLYYRRAADRGHGRAMNLLGRCYEAGWGCEKNPGLAALWYERSAATGYFRGQFNHGCMLLEEGRIAEAAGWLKQAALQGDDSLRRHVRQRLASAGLPPFNVI